MDSIAIIENESLVIIFFTDAQKYIQCHDFLQESRNHKIDGQWSIRFDRGQPHIPVKDHIHILQRGNDFMSINKDGTAHDGSTGRIPNKVAKFIQMNFSDFVMPANGLLEAFAFEVTAEKTFKPFYYNAKESAEYLEYVGGTDNLSQEYWHFE